MDTSTPLPLRELLAHSDGHVFVISGPSGAGKDTIIEQVKKRMHFVHVVTVTTRPQREYEIEGVHYRFISVDGFDDMRVHGELLENAFVHGHWYGVPADTVRSALEQNQNVLIKVDPQGAHSIKNVLPNAIFIFLKPASMDELLGRLLLRGSENEAERELRLRNAERELQEQAWFDFTIENADGQMERAIEELMSIVQIHAGETKKGVLAMEHRGFDPSATQERNIALELVRVTEAAALNAAPYMGQARKEDSDGAAVDGMRSALNGVDMAGVVVIGEGEKDQAPMLYIGEEVGNNNGPHLDIAVDPIDGTTLLSLGLPGSIAVIATSERGTMYAPPPGVFYMEKIAVSTRAAHVIDIDAPVAVNLQHIAEVRNCSINDIVVTILDRDRHKTLIQDVRNAGARIKLIRDGDVIAAIQAVMEDYRDVDVYMGIGGAPEAVLAAAAIRCLGGDMQARIWPRSEDERARLIEQNIDIAKIYHAIDLVSGQSISFAATGITTGDLLRGVEFTQDGARTNSIMMRSRSGTIRYIEAVHRFKHKYP